MSNSITHQKYKETQLSQFKELLNELQIDLTMDDQLKIKYDRTERLERASWYESEIVRLETELKEPLKDRFDQVVSTLSDHNRLVIHKYETLSRQHNEKGFWLKDSDSNVYAMLHEFAKFGHKAGSFADRTTSGDILDMRGLFFSMTAAFPTDYDEFVQYKEQRKPGFLRVTVHAYRRWSADIFSMHRDDLLKYGNNLLKAYADPLVEFYFVGSIVVIMDSEMNIKEVHHNDKEDSDRPPMPNLSMMGAPTRSLKSSAFKIPAAEPVNNKGL